MKTGVGAEAKMGLATGRGAWLHTGKCCGAALTEASRQGRTAVAFIVCNAIIARYADKLQTWLAGGLVLWLCVSSESAGCSAIYRAVSDDDVL